MLDDSAWRSKKRLKHRPGRGFLIYIKNKVKQCVKLKKKASAHNLDISRVASHKTKRQQIQHTEIIASGNETSNTLKEIPLFLQQHNQRGLEKLIL